MNAPRNRAAWLAIALAIGAAMRPPAAKALGDDGWAISNFDVDVAVRPDAGLVDAPGRFAEGLPGVGRIPSRLHARAGIRLVRPEFAGRPSVLGRHRLTADDHGFESARPDLQLAPAESTRRIKLMGGELPFPDSISPITVRKPSW